MNANAKAADHVNRALAVTTTVWHAMQSRTELTDIDISALTDTLFEAMLRLQEAEKELNVYYTPLVGKEEAA